MKSQEYRLVREDVFDPVKPKFNKIEKYPTNFYKDYAIESIIKIEENKIEEEEFRKELREYTKKNNLLNEKNKQEKSNIFDFNKLKVEEDKIFYSKKDNIEYIEEDNQ